ncbi:class I SAM-dependent methyltransferase [Micromonospora endolithica]|uniref:SAM-dependent methyltransferase n=1 Tax=Micromonospora endolithica TaxID=230091 RepID=A0A3A9Z3J6_9ACTN|nr:rRNA adenine N-6-methyltransferase family protein [Micromonospora endolithica]RKN41986.1 SAM-dependent methyltransferase [Micromonospora endolithica]TWJ26215.1 phospholipid N-methyltransferase [Micromonospora endolithica]
MSVINDLPTFVTQFVRHPLAVGAALPSGTRLARDITAAVPRTGHPVVVELGPGTGAFTRTLRERLGGRGHHLAVEVNPRFAARLAQRHPGVRVLAADAAALGALLAAERHPYADLVVSGLPWAAFRAERQRDILHAVVGALGGSGVFTTFAYRHALVTPPARTFRRLLEGLFEEVTVGRTVWGNVPPALVYHCRRPVRRTG